VTRSIAKVVATPATDPLLFLAVIASFVNRRDQS
jgi:hypothetical protein